MKLIYLSLTLCFLCYNSSADVVNATPNRAIFHSDEDHLWNRLHSVFFVRADKQGNEFGGDLVDPYLWPTTTDFLLKGSTHARAISLLDEFIKDNGHRLISEPLKRAVLQHDLWSIFDWTANYDKGLPFGGNPKALANSNDLNESRKALRERLSKVINLLALDEVQALSLINNYSKAVGSNSYLNAFDDSESEKPFLPTDLLSDNGDWVCIRGALQGPSAPVHMRYYGGRSPFLVFLNIPGGRTETFKYINSLNKVTAAKFAESIEVKDLPQFPKGTAVALVRKMSLITKAGKILTSSIVQTVQIRVYDKVGEDIKDHNTSQHVYKFVLNRKDLFESINGGLKPVKKNSIEGLSLIYSSDYFENEKLKPNSSVMKSCIDCHSCGGGTIHSIFTYKQDDWVPEAAGMGSDKLRLLPTRILDEQKRAISWKYKRHDWGLLQGWIETISKR
ncbi:MAG: hypothetical protein QF426_01290 [Verrucomicrobiales bacterium]|nr:hypothetical protein [Verrucomicrobiales bacterium]